MTDVSQTINNMSTMADALNEISMIFQASILTVCWIALFVMIENTCTMHNILQKKIQLSICCLLICILSSYFTTHIFIGIILGQCMHIFSLYRKMKNN